MTTHRLLGINKGFPRHITSSLNVLSPILLIFQQAHLFVCVVMK